MKVYIDTKDLELGFTDATERDLRSTLDILIKQCRNFSVIYREENYGDHLIDRWTVIVNNTKGDE